VVAVSVEGAALSVTGVLQAPAELVPGGVVIGGEDEIAALRGAIVEGYMRRPNGAEAVDVQAVQLARGVHELREVDVGGEKITGREAAGVGLPGGVGVDGGAVVDDPHGGVIGDALICPTGSLKRPASAMPSPSVSAAR